MKKKIISKNKKFLTSILGRVGSYNISEYLKACKWQHQWDKSIKEAIKSHLNGRMFQTSDARVFIPYFSKGKFCLYGIFTNMEEVEALERFWGRKCLRLNNRK